ncbi:hypothetical protein BDN72DRAFT_218904 [Pluteus cervinus]|uniref:Uncharacterized protein n=1 Tax=Pluteus cervinus TaxID=181527 RepID=A0ACD3AH21_9AGAR|nr:hypothetical protein BDN72DRAFT_218904 [Pluteus cervinus]
MFSSLYLPINQSFPYSIRIFTLGVFVFVVPNSLYEYKYERTSTNRRQPNGGYHQMIAVIEQTQERLGE